MEVDSPSRPSFERKERGLLSFEEKTWLPNFSSGLRPGKNAWWSCARVCLGWVCISMSLAAELLPETRTFQLCICGFSSHLLSVMFILTRNSFMGWWSGGSTGFYGMCVQPSTPLRRFGCCKYTSPMWTVQIILHIISKCWNTCITQDDTSLFILSSF